VKFFIDTEFLNLRFFSSFHAAIRQVFGITIMRITEDGFELAVDSILHILHSEAFERNFAETVRKLLSSSSNNKHSSNKTHRKSRRQAATPKKSHLN
jgi:hypothetical protein